MIKFNLNLKATIAIFNLLAVTILFAAGNKGHIGGMVSDKRTLQPLAGANIVIESLGSGAATDTDGHFSILNLEPGSYNIDVYYLGYKTLKKGNVIVNPNRTTVLELVMDEDLLESETIDVTASYFDKPKNAVVSARSMDFEEIRRSPGDVLDIQRAVQALPAVVSGSDQLNEIIIRGGYPGENLFIMDNIEIPNPNHFAIQGAGGGPINMLNSYMVRNVDFYAGAFSAKYGDKASSVMDISLRNGSTERFRAEGSLGMAGVGGLIEGPVSDVGSYIFSARKSYLDLIISSTGLTAVPHYYNLQGKMTLNLNPKNTLFFNAVYGRDRINIEDEEEAGYGRGAENVNTHNSQTIAGLTLRTFWAKKLYSFTTLSAVQNDYDVDVYEFRPERHTFFTNRSKETEYTFKSDFVYQLSKHIEFDFGASVKQLNFDYDVWSEADTLFLYDPGTSNSDSAIGIFRAYPEYLIDQNEKTYKSAGYLQASVDLIKKFRLTGGLRYDYFDYNNFSSVSPRTGLSYFFSPKTTFNLAYGKHFQSPAYVELAANINNNKLKSKYTDQYVVGIEHLFRDDMKLVVEAYYKTYKDLAVKKTLTTPDPYDYDDGTYLNAGKGDSKGIEFFFQKKLTRSFSTIISYSHSISQAEDPRYGTKFDWDYDYRNVFTFITGYKFRWMNDKWYRDLKNKWWFHGFSWLPIAPADELEISMKFRYLGGRPYTPPVYHPELQEWVVEEQQILNPERYPEYHRLDLRIDRRFIFNSWNLVVFFDIMNIYGRDNIWSYQYNDDGTRERVLQYETLPIGGVSIEF
ncbi:MAG: TonB-dependent receptor [Calditrichaceae bacterium]